MKKLLCALLWFLVIAVVLGVIGGIVYLDWVAYFQRFPNAEWWTFFFK